VGRAVFLLLLFLSCGFSFLDRRVEKAEDYSNSGTLRMRKNKHRMHENSCGKERDM
jgi:hypothetical protein